MSVFVSLLLTLRTWARSRPAVQLEVLTLRHQLQVLQRAGPRRLQLTNPDRCLWIVLSRVVRGLGGPGGVGAESDRRPWPLIFAHSFATGGPQIRAGTLRGHGELLKLGIAVSQATVAK
jgi:hypothetical protein